MIDYDRLMGLEIQDVTASYGVKDSILYALGLGFGQDPTDERQLRYVYEKDLVAAPTLPLVLALPGFWIRDLDTGIDWRRIVYGEQSVELHSAIAPKGTVRATMRITDVIDKGEGSGALLYAERVLHDAASNEVIATMKQTVFCRGDGGFGGPPREQPMPHAVPERAPDMTCTLPTLPQQALIYRLSGDYNPLHADPEFARNAGFERPILHGLATFGVATHAILRELCGYDPARLTSIAGRFTRPVFPGDMLQTQIWDQGSEFGFRVIVPERDVVAIDNGRATVSG
ncbi:MAG: MaoC family dehydratase N-terminal domain-containing protein [Rhizobiaceae bacterium]|nr:MaoC family dehydratase N-terminal domain-containing protein [Rhizobiaceae bacterium]